MGEDILTLPPPPADEELAYAPGPSRFGELRRPRVASKGLIVLIHGGFWRARYDLRHTGHLAAALTARGFTTFNVEYRRLGEAGGGWPGTFEDALAAARFAATLDPKPPIFMGHSAGGHLALWLGSNGRTPCRRVVALAPVSDLESAFTLRLSGDVVVELLGGTPSEQPARYREASPIALKSSVKRVVIHGADDDVVPASMSASYAQRTAAELVVLPKTGHFELIDPRSPAFNHVVTAAA